MFQLVPVSGGNRNVPGGSGKHRSLPSEMKYMLDTFKSIYIEWNSRVIIKNTNKKHDGYKIFF